MQRLLGVDIESETPNHEKTPLISEQSNLLHDTGVLLGERMVRLVEYHVLLNTKPADAFKGLEKLKDQTDKINTALTICCEMSRHVLAPILTKEQREYIESNKEAVKGSDDKAEIYNGLDRAITIDRDYIAGHSPVNKPEQIIDQNKAKEITLELIPT